MPFEITALGREYIDNPPRGGVAAWIKPSARPVRDEAASGPLARADKLWARTDLMLAMNCSH
jgi:hypothetical protein